MSDPGRGDDELPLDSDVEVDDVVGRDGGGSGGGARAGGADAAAAAGHPARAVPPRPAHLRPELLLLVGVGGAVGTLARYGLQQAVPAQGGVPVVTVAINFFGAFLLGLLLETLIRRGPDEGSRRALRVLLGTGVLGGFTTYSALSADTVNLFHDGRPGLALLYAVGTVVVGAVGSVLGIALGVRANRRRDAAAVRADGAR